MTGGVTGRMALVEECSVWYTVLRQVGLGPFLDHLQDRSVFPQRRRIDGDWPPGPGRCRGRRDGGCTWSPGLARYPLVGIRAVRVVL
jgi:hypothetical protein